MSKTRNILFYGGSITCGAGASEYGRSWARIVFDRLNVLLGGSNRMINASISGTGSFLGAMRLKEHVLGYAPDIAFIEFASNDLDFSEEEPDANVGTIESIVSGLVSANPEVSVIFVYTTVGGRNASSVYHTVAQNFGIPEIDLQTRVMEEVNSGRRSWDDLFVDVVHPGDAGHRFYADLVTDAVTSDMKRFLSPVRMAPGRAKIPLNDPRIVHAAPGILDTCDGFRLQPVEDYLESKHMPELTVRNAFCSDGPGSRMSFRFEGRHFGLYHRFSINGGNWILSIDEIDIAEYSTYFQYSENFKGQGEFLCQCRVCGLDPGEHTAEVRALEGPHGNDIAIAGFLIG